MPKRDLVRSFCFPTPGISAHALPFGHFLGHSGSFIEVRLTPDWAYGVSNWRWGVNILRVFPWL